MKKKILFYGPSSVMLAREIIVNHEWSARERRQQPAIELGHITWGKFQDGWPKIRIENVEDYRGRDAYFVASFSSPADIFAQFGAMCALPQYGVRSLTVILPFFSCGQTERVEIEGEVATAMTLSRMLDAIPNGGGGCRRQVVIYDIHALQQRFYFHDIVPRLETAVPLLLRTLDLVKERLPEIAIAFPDDGAYKRFGKMFEGYPTIVCSKVRRDNERVVTIKEGDPRGRHVVVVDDLVQTGGTLIECAKLLKAEGAQAISAYATHAVFPQDSWKKFIAGGEYYGLFEYFWITDSCLNARIMESNDGPFDVLSLAGPLGRLIESDNFYG